MTEVRYTSAGGVVIHAGKMLLLLRPSRDEVRLPKGHVDPGETPEIAAVRETAEESGYADLEIVADLGEQIVKFQHRGDDYVRTEHYFLMKLRSERLAARPPHDEAQFETAWVALEEAVDKLTFDAEKNTARKAIAAYRTIPGDTQCPTPDRTSS